MVRLNRHTPREAVNKINTNKDKRVANGITQFDHWSRILPALAVSGLGAMFYNILPLFIGAAQDAFSLSSFQAGTIATAFFAGWNLATILAFFWIQRVNWRIATIVWLAITFFGLLSGLFATSYAKLLVTVLISGMGFAALYGLGTRILADTSDPSRWYGIKVGVEVIPGATLLVVLPSTLLLSMGMSGVIWGMIGMSLVISFALFTMPADGRAPTGESSVDKESTSKTAFESLKWPVWMALACTCIYFAAASAIWSFLERMGASGGLTTIEIGNILALTLVFATSGSFLTGWLGSRFGNVNPFLISILALIASLLLLAGFETPRQYAIAACIFSFMFGVGVPFAVAEVAKRDPDGRYVILSVPAIGFGAMIGPALGGLLITGTEFIMLCGTVATIMLVTGLVIRLGRS